MLWVPVGFNLSIKKKKGLNSTLAHASSFQVGSQIRHAVGVIWEGVKFSNWNKLILFFMFLPDVTQKWQ